jgi:hypothetical protein
LSAFVPFSEISLLTYQFALNILFGHAPQVVLSILAPFDVKVQSRSIPVPRPVFALPAQDGKCVWESGGARC